MADDELTTESEEASADAPAPRAVGGEGIAPVPSVLERLQALPEVVRKFLLSPELAETHTKIFDRHAVPQDDRDVIYYTELQAFFGEIPVSEFPDKVWARLDWDDSQEDKAAALIADLMGNVFLPAQKHLGDVTAVLTDIGGDLGQYDVKPLQTRQVSYQDGAKEIADAAGMDDLSDDMRKRLAHIIESRLRAVRDDQEVREMLMKPKKTGGLELSEKDAERVVNVLSSKVRMTQFVEATEDAAAASDKGGAPAEAPKPELSAADIKRLYGGTPEEQEAIAKRVEKFKQVTEGDQEKMRDAFHQVLFPPDQRPTDPYYVIAGLLAMADGDRFTEAVENDERYRSLLRLWLSMNGHEDEIPAYDANPTEPHFMNMLLQLLLRSTAEFDENESARLALRVTNALKKQGYDRYANLVAFDMGKGKFVWKDPLELPAT